VRYRVLVADDNVDTATAFGALIEAMGHEVHVAHDGLEALEMARRLRPDAIFLDCAMPWISGDEVCRRLRQEPWAQTVLIAAATGFGSAEDRKRSFDSGFDYHLVKPIDPRLVRNLLQYL
jgi:CheY-like chemotaxis protein